jgi:hypothetical protein
MPLFRILVILAVLGVCAAVLALVFNILKALLIVGGIALAVGIVFGLRGFRRGRPAIAAQPVQPKLPRGRAGK